MIGHYLLTLTPEQESRVLTRALEPQCEDVRRGLGLPLRQLLKGRRYGCGCLIMVANQDTRWDPEDEYSPDIVDVGMRYEDLCERFGPQVINAAIRDRVLSNRARRMGITGPAKIREELTLGGIR